MKLASFTYMLALDHCLHYVHWCVIMWAEKK